MRVLTPGGIDTMDPTEFAARTAAAGRVVVDIGTGDARRALRLARDRPADLIVGLDANADGMREVAARATRKPAKGGVENLVLVWASIESVPAELVGHADEAYVILPWGRLLEGLVHGDSEVLSGLSSVGRPASRYRLVINCDIWELAGPRLSRALPEATPELFERLAPKLSDVGFEPARARYLDVDEIEALASSWARRLRASNPHARFLGVDLIRRP